MLLRVNSEWPEYKHKLFTYRWLQLRLYKARDDSSPFFSLLTAVRVAMASENRPTRTQFTSVQHARKRITGNSGLLWRTKGEPYAILSSWVASGHHQFGSGTQERFAANARLPFHLLIEEVSGSVNDAQE